MGISINHFFSKHLSLKAIFLIFGFSLLAGFVIITKLSQKPVVFLDPGLELVIREKIEKSDGEIFRACLLKITHLDASNRNIAKLDGIEHLSRLESLNLSNNKIRDLAPLSGLKRLFDLNLDNNKITCLQAAGLGSLSGVPLRKLSLRNNVRKHYSAEQKRLSDISMLAAFTSLQELDLRGNEIVDISVFAFLPGIQWLNLRDNHISDISVLEQLRSLRHLNLRNNFLHDISSLSPLIRLEYLNLHSNTRIKSIAPLSNLKHLRFLSLRHIPLQGQLDALKNMRSLRHLNVRNCGITDIDRFFKILKNNDIYYEIDQEVFVPVRINEVMASNVSTLEDEDGDYEGWVELFNSSSESVDLTGWGLSDRVNDPYRWIFPEGTVIPGKGYLIVWTSGKDMHQESLHANFSLSSLGEELILTTEQGIRVDFLPAIAIPAGHSLGRSKEHPFEWVYFEKPTPSGPNDSIAYKEMLVPVQFSQPGGFYTQDVTIELSHGDPEAVIVYTKDGSTPCIDNLKGTAYFYRNSYAQENGQYVQDLIERRYYSHIYEEPLHVSNRSSDPDVLTQISSTADSTPGYFPSTPVRKATVIQARAFKRGAIASRSAANTYFIEPEGNPYSVPVISLQIQENFLFDYNEGVYTAGSDFIVGDQASGNYFRRGRRWEYPLHVEIFYPDRKKAVVSQNAGFRIHGHTSRPLAIKNLRIYARGAYDNRREFKYDFFDEKVTFSTSAREARHKRLLLRGTGSQGPISSDVIHTRLMQPVFEGMVRIKPAVHFINGEFWGYTTIRDRFDRYHIGYHYDVEPDNVVFVRQGRLFEGKPEDMDEYNNMVNFIIKNDMTDDMLFSKAQEMLCLRSYADHYIINIYSHNSHYEPGFWRAREPSDQHFADGRWRAYIQDFDATLRDARWLMVSRSRDRVFSGLLRNKKFRHFFINRFADHINSTFVSERFISVIEHAYDEVEGLLEEHSHRLNNYAAVSSVEQVFTGFQRRFLIGRAGHQPFYQRQQIKENFGIKKSVELRLDVSDPSHGYIRINTIHVHSETPGVEEDPYPWTGVYFKNIPIELEAIASKGHAFRGWQVEDQGEPDKHSKSFYSEQEEIRLLLEKPAVIRAIFD